MSSLLLYALEKAEFQLNHPTPTKRYYQISAGSQNVEQLLLKAFREGIAVLL